MNANLGRVRAKPLKNLGLILTTVFFRVKVERITRRHGTYDKNTSSKSNKFTDEQRGFLSKLTQGTTIFIDNIMAKGDDGTTRPLSPIGFKIK